MSAPATTGSTTTPAAAPASTQEGPPSSAAPSTDQAPAVKYEAPTRKAKNFKAKEPAPASSGPKNPGLSMMLSGVSDLPFYGVKHNEVSYMIPDFGQFFFVLSTMDTQMVRTKRFTDANSDWHPFVSQLYFSVLVYYQTLKNQALAGMISHDQQLFLEFLDSHFKAEHLKIPGPLVVFFQSLAANAGPNENFGNMTFGIPSTTSMCQKNHYLWNDNLHLILPNIILTLDQFARLINMLAPNNAAAPALSNTHTDNLYGNVFGEQANNNTANRIVMLSPNARQEVQTTVGLLSGLAASANIWRSTLPLDNNGHSIYTSGQNTSPLSLDQILGFRGVLTHYRQTYNWFSQVARIMQPYCDFFKDSVSLGAISTIGTGIGYIVTTYTGDPSNAHHLLHEITTRDVRYREAGTPRYDIPTFGDIATWHSHPEEYLELVTEQAGTLTQLNTNWDALNTSNEITYTGPTFEFTHCGPIHDLPHTRRTAVFRVGNTIPTLISGYYHTPSALKFE
nr:TPA_asm: coat protein [Alphapartitivirus sp.]